MVKLVNQTIFAAKIKGKSIPVFSSNQVIALFGLSETAADQLLHRYTKSGFIIRLKKGLYAFPDALPPDVFIANRLYEPSYVSLEFALSYHGIIPETVYIITSITTKATRRFEFGGKVFIFRRIKKQAFTGYESAKFNGINFLIADAEKAFIDAQYFRLFEGQKPLSRFRKDKINKTRALSYARLFKNNKLISIIKTSLS
ncbi:hypothetical protein C4544_05400 [candidate division WS5 bacterium]|uniref:AbiEi antitoxin N-terminal domain-containing protein n=1 Tax=candidate division WS5 bacterium TaxID=2093353 RepID=A0A419DAU6_9BACT|nr:MAG: hypothetical protein C4544_05400 [candidate division WS5 bacterium]